jgi:hypothetical protein
MCYNDLKIGDAVEVVWFDSHAPQKSGWLPEVEAIEDLKVFFTIRTVSIYIEKTENFILVVGDRAEGDTFTTTVNRPINIPILAIKSIKKL